MTSLRSNARTTSPSPELIAKVTAQLRKREKSHQTKAIALMLGGVPLVFVAPLVIGSCVYFLNNHRRHYTFGGWLNVTTITTCVTVPLLFLFERITGGGFMNATAEAVGNSSFSYGAGRAGAAALFVDIFCWGPRMILSGIRRLRAASACRNANYDMAANWICRLLKLDQGTVTHELLDPNNPVSIATLSYLTTYDWIDISVNGGRIWILSDARKVLTQS